MNRGSGQQPRKENGKQSNLQNCEFCRRMVPHTLATEHKGRIKWVCWDCYKKDIRR